MRILGLDEAGRGSVLGPLVVGGFLAEEEIDLRAAGAADSKALSHRARVAARGRLAGLGVGATVVISPGAIDAGNVNALEEDAFVALALQLRPDVLYLDAPVNPRGIPALTARLLGRLGAGGSRPRMIVEPKADVTYAVVGAASIFAKVARDALVAELGSVGSGYPSDPVTRRWIQGFLDRGEALPACVRTRWGTIDKLRQQGLF